MKKGIIESMELGLIKSIESVRRGIKRKKDNLEWNKKRYWNFTASERLHYDFAAKEIEEDNNSSVLSLTFGIAKLFGLLL